MNSAAAWLMVGVLVAFFLPVATGLGGAAGSAKVYFYNPEATINNSTWRIVVPKLCTELPSRGVASLG